MLVVHHLGISQSDRIVWLCEELGLPYELRRYDRDPVTRLAPPAYRALTPYGTAPVIVDGDLTLGETGAIVEYLVAVHGGGRLSIKPGEPGYADYLHWFHFANGSMVPAAINTMVGSLFEGADAELIASIAGRLDRAFDHVEARLGEAPWFAGDAFTTADIMMVFSLTTMRMFVPRDLAPYPAIRAYLQRIGERPAFRRAMAKADPGFTVPLS